MITNDNNCNRSREEEYANIINIIRAQPEFEHFSETEIQVLAASLKELSLLIYELASQSDSTK